PSRTRSKEGILNSDWINLGGGDGFSCVFDGENSNLVYTESQEGELFRFDLATGYSKKLRPAPPEGQPGFRFHWNSPLIGARLDPAGLSKEPGPGAAGGPPGFPFPRTPAADRPPPRSRRSLPRRQPDLSPDRPRREMDGDQPGSLDTGPGADDGDGKRRRNLW